MTETTEAPAGSASGSHRRPSRRKGLIEWVAVVAIALAAAFLIKTFLVQAYYIPSPSMVPAIDVGDRVLVNKIAYDLHAVHRSDIVVFRKPVADLTPGIEDLIKRVVGLPGETLRTGPGGTILVNGKTLPEPYLTPSARANPGPPICSINRTDCVGNTLHLPKGEYFVMGDNRGNSEDSRYFGPISRRLLVGRAFVRIWPLARIHWFTG